jgi:hypothetical protein
MSKHRRNKRAKRLEGQNNWSPEAKRIYDLIVQSIQEATVPFIGTPATRWNSERMIMEVQRAIGPHMHDIQYDYDTLSGNLEVSGIVNTSQVLGSWPHEEVAQINIRLD